MVCPKCGTENEPDARACASCGEPLGVPAEERLTGAETLADLGLPDAAATRYRIIAERGRGGMGIVYHARDTQLDVDVALKILPRELASSRRAKESLLSEARKAAKLRSHPNIVTLFDVCVEGEQPYLTMEYVEGPNLATVLDTKGPVPPGDVIRYAKGIASALECAHKNGVIHRDIKPANIMLDADGNAKVTDFGIARSVKDSYTKLTSAAPTSGTLMYMAPEQLRGQPCSPASDIYSLGCTLYELATGGPPFASGDITYLHINEPPRPPQEARPGVPKPLSDLILRCLAKKPEDRYESASALLDDLERVATGKSIAAPQAAAPNPKKARLKVGVGLAAVLLCALVIWALVPGHKQPTDPRPSVSTTPAGNEGAANTQALRDLAGVDKAQAKAKAERDLAFHASAQGLASDLWQRAEELSSLAVSLDSKGDYAGAAGAWTKAAAEYEAARGHAADVARGQAAKAAYDKAVASAAQLTAERKYGPAMDALKTVTNSWPSTEWGKKADVEMGRIRNDAYAEYKKLSDRADALAQNKDFAGARQLYALALGFGVPQVSQAVERQLAGIRQKEEAQQKVSTPGRADAPEPTLEELIQRVTDCEKKLADAGKIYTAESTQVRTARADLQKSFEELLPRVEELKKRYEKMSRDMLPNHPKMQALAADIRAGMTTISGAARKLGPTFVDEAKKHLGAIEPEVYDKWPFDSVEAKRRQKETAEALGLPVEKTIDLGNGVKLELVLIPAGKFMMGRPNGEDGGSDEQPQHKVRITRPFYIGKYELTQEQWERVMGNNPSNFKGAKNPVETVSWDDCQQFIGKLNRMGLRPGGASATEGTFSLPTESEWEYACRAGSTTKYCFGDGESDLGDYAWYSSNSSGKTRPVGEKKPNAFGLYDMHGNVWEWCVDWYGEYKAGAQDDPTGAATGQFRVVRGGSWFYSPGTLRSAIRSSYTPGYRRYVIGVRVVLSASGP